MEKLKDTWKALPRISSWRVVSNSDPLKVLCLLLRDMMEAADRKQKRATTDKRYKRGQYAEKPPTEKANSSRGLSPRSAPCAEWEL